MAKRKDHRGRALNTGEYQRADLTYEYKYTDYTGRRKSVYAPTLEDLRKKEEACVRDKLDGIHTTDLTFGQLYKIWLHGKRGIKPTTYDHYVNTYNRYLAGRAGFDDMPVHRITFDTVRSMYTRMYDSGLSFNIISTLHNIVMQVLDVAVCNDLVRRNVAKKALTELSTEHKLCKQQAMMNGEDQRARALTLSEQNRLFDFLLTKHCWCRNIFRFLLLTGLRFGEFAGLQWSDVDLEKRQLTIRHNLVRYKGRDGKKCELHISTPKGNSFRVVPLADEAYDILLVQKAVGKRSKVAVDECDDFVWVTQQRTPYGTVGVDKLLRRIVADANEAAGEDDVQLPQITPHWLRHTFATRLFEAKVPPKAVQALLGHADIQITLNVYTDVTKELKEAEIANLSDYLRAHESTTNLRQIF